MSKPDNHEKFVPLESHFRQLLELGALGIIEWEDHGLITGASPAFLAMSGYSEEELAAGRLNFFRLTPPECHPVIVDAMGTLKGTGIAPTLTLQYFRKDGSRADVVVSSVAADEERTRGKSWVLDVSGRVEAERSLLFERTLMGIVGHDLRSPLTTIAVSAGLVLREGNLSERQELLVRRMAASAERASRMIRDLLEFTRARLGRICVDPRPADLREVAEGVLAELKITHPEREVLLRCEGETAGLWDADRIAQLLMNLLSNAVHYSPPDALISVHLHCDAGGASLRVHNQGPPIPEDLRQTLFEPMTHGRAHVDREGGLGLGLYIVDQIVRAHGGSIALESDETAGTAFTVTLPRTAERERSVGS